MIFNQKVILSQIINTYNYEEIGFILAAIVFIISGYFTVLKINRYSAQSIEKDKFIANIKAGRKSYDEALTK